LVVASAAAQGRPKTSEALGLKNAQNWRPYRLPKRLIGRATIAGFQFASSLESARVFLSAYPDAGSPRCRNRGPYHGGFDDAVGPVLKLPGD